MGLTVYGGGGKPEEEKTVTAGTSAIVVLPSSGKTMKKVTVNPTPTESKEVTASTGDITVSPTNGKHLSGVTVHPTPSQEKTVIPTADGFKVSPETGKLLSAVFVDGDSDLVGENIKQGVNIFGVDGSFDNSHGAYVWKKCECDEVVTTLLTNPSFDITSFNSNYGSGDLVVDLTPIKKFLSEIEINSFLDGFGIYDEYNSQRGQLLYKGGKLLCGTNNVTATISGTSLTLTNTRIDIWMGGTGKLTLTGERTLYEYHVIGNFLNFVISDNPTAYPDGGEQGGYWYEKFQLDPTLFGCTKYAVDKFTLTSDVVASNNYISHSLGVIPLFALLITVDASANGRYIKYAIILGGNETNPNLGLFAYRSMQTNDGYYGVTNIFEDKLRINYGSTSYKAGVEYTLITMA